MSLDPPAGPAGPGEASATPQRAPLRLIRAAHPGLATQQGFVDDCSRVMRRAQASGERLVVALYLVLRRHRAVPGYDPAEGLHLICAECRSHSRPPAERYPCPTARQAYWALDAVVG